MISVRKMMRMSVILLGAGIGLLGSRDIVGSFFNGTENTTLSLVDSVRADVPECTRNCGDGGDGGGADCP
jgi:hypothetical protein